MKKLPVSTIFIFFFLLSMAFSEESITGTLRKYKNNFYIVEKEETQSCTTYDIQKKNSDKKAWKMLKSFNGKVVTAECRIIHSSSPFSHKIEILSVEEYTPCQPSIQNP